MSVTADSEKRPRNYASLAIAEVRPFRLIHWPDFVSVLSRTKSASIRRVKMKSKDPGNVPAKAPFLRFNFMGVFRPFILLWNLYARERKVFPLLCWGNCEEIYDRFRRWIFRLWQLGFSFILSKNVDIKILENSKFFRRWKWFRKCFWFGIVTEYFLHNSVSFF